MSAAVPTEADARAASKVIDHYIDDRPGVTLPDALEAQAIIDAWRRANAQDDEQRRAS